ncbi:MAG: cytochrome P450 [Saprospiraceae bacterium]
MQLPLHEIPKYRTLLNAPRFLTNPIQLMEENIARFGDTYRFTMGKHPAIFTANPNFIQHILQKQHKRYVKSPPHFEKIARYLGYGLLTIDGSRWVRQRKLIQPGFSKKRIAKLTEIMHTVITDFLADFDKKIEKGPVDLYEEMQQLAFNLVARSIFNLDIDSQQLQTISERISYLQHYVIKEIRTPFLMPWLKLSGQHPKAIKLAAENDELIRQFIRKRRQSNQSYDDLLQMLIDARYEDNGEPMEEQQLLDEVKILFVAGHDTTGNALSWVWHLLAKHPDWLNQVQQEVQQQSQGAFLPYQAILKLQKTKQVIEETMRLYPPAWITDRMAIESDHFQGIDIPKGTMVITFFYGAHHHADYWKAPSHFRPERFDPTFKTATSKQAFFPFGAGPRLCIGHHFAMLEMSLVLARMAGRYTFKPVNSQVDPLALITLKPKSGIWMEVEKRQ